MPVVYSLHVFGKVRLPKIQEGYIHIRMYVGEEDGEKIYRLHSIYLDKDGRVILKKSDELEWFNEWRMEGLIMKDLRVFIYFLF